MKGKPQVCLEIEADLVAAATGDADEANLRRAIVHGTVLASFVVEDFGGRRMRTLTRDDIERRYRQWALFPICLGYVRPA